MSDLVDIFSFVIDIQSLKISHEDSSRRHWFFAYLKKMKVRRCSRFRANESQWEVERADEIVFLIPYFSQRLKWNWERERVSEREEDGKQEKKRKIFVWRWRGKKSLDFLYFPAISGENQGKKANGNSIIFFFVAATDSDRTLEETTRKKKKKKVFFYIQQTNRHEMFKDRTNRTGRQGFM